MMSKLRILLTSLLVMVFALNAAGQDILMTIGDKEISLDEFERIYRKNNSNLTVEQQSPEEYLELFINFKLKVLEAERLGMDTTSAFLNEFNKYRDQLAKPYLTDEETKQALMMEAYERMQYDLRVSHILLGLDPQPSPEDTLAVYEKAMKIRDRIIKGESFETVAKATSDDPSARVNGGDLGYFTVFMMLYPFETAAYALSEGEVSMPVRTHYGYHILKLQDRRPAVGQVKVAHIFIRTPEEAPAEFHEDAKRKIFLAYDSLASGASFAGVASVYSEDMNTAASGGELPWFGTGRMIPEFEKRAFALRYPEEVSQPFKSFYGWHIIKLLEKKPIGTYEEMESDLQSKAVRGDREMVKKSRFLAKLQDKFNYQLNEGTFDALYTYVDTTVFSGTWSADSDPSLAKEVLFTIEGKPVLVKEFASYIEENQNETAPIPIKNYVDFTFSKFIEEFLFNTEKARLPLEHPDYRYILQEYHDGILLFDLMDQKVWSAAVKDTIGLEAFHAAHRENYMWESRMKAMIVSCDSAVDIDAVLKKAPKIAKGKWGNEKLRKKFCGSDTLHCITVESVLLEEGRNPHVDAMNNSIGVGKVYNEAGKFRFVITNEIVPPTPKALNETRGQVTSDYQDYLEEQWIESLRDKYPVNVNKQLLQRIQQ